MEIQKRILLKNSSGFNVLSTHRGHSPSVRLSISCHLFLIWCETPCPFPMTFKVFDYVIVIAHIRCRHVQVIRWGNATVNLFDGGHGEGFQHLTFQLIDVGLSLLEFLEQALKLSNHEIDIETCLDQSFSFLFQKSYHFLSKGENVLLWTFFICVIRVPLSFFYGL